MKINFIFIAFALAYSIYADAQKSAFRTRVDNIDHGFGTNYDDFVRGVNRTYETFRDSVNAMYADFMRQAWGSVPVQPGKPKPKDTPVPPVKYDEKKEQMEDKEQPVIVEPVDTAVTPQPVPVAPIYENDDAKDYTSITVFGTSMRVRMADLSSFKLGQGKEKAFAEAFTCLTDKRYNNLIRDCLSNRIQYSLCDWAYYKMLQAIADKACGEGTDEATFVLGVMLNQSGYAVRFAYDADTQALCLLVKTSSHLYEKALAVVGEDTFYSLEPIKATVLHVCDVVYPGEKSFSLDISQIPKFADSNTESRKIIGASFSMNVTSTVNKNLIDFFDTYPASYSDGNFMTKWAYYANTPVCKEVKEQLYPQLKTLIATADKKTAANMLLNWVQTGLKYEYDDVVWGHERSFFAEESLYYPFCDCEDRSILYSHLVRDLLDLDVVLVYYPNHLATAVCFPNETKGDHLTVDGRTFVIADATYIGAPVGRTMPGMDNAVAKVILLRKTN